MKNKKRYTLLPALVLLLAAFLLGPPKLVRAEGEKSLSRVQLYKGEDKGWAQFYIVDDKDKTLKVDDLGITVFDEDNQEVDQSKYVARFLRVWWDEDGRELQDDRTDSISLSGIDEGEISYTLQILAKENSGYIGEITCEKEIYILHSKSLGHFCSTEDFGEEAFRKDYRMRDGFMFFPDSIIPEPIIRSCDGKQLTKDLDYTITYYKAGDPTPGQWDSEQWPDYFFLEGQPLESGIAAINDGGPGWYYARITGIDPYYDVKDVMIFKGNFIYIDSFGDDVLWSDGKIDYKLNIPDDIKDKLELYVGDIGSGVDADASTWDTLLEEGTHYNYNDTSGILTLYGDKIFNTIGCKEINIHAVCPSDDETEYAEGWKHCEIKEMKFDYDFNFNNELLPDWDGFIDKSREVYVRCPDIPDGEDYEFEITNVRLKAGDEDILDLEQEVNEDDADDYWWKYTAKQTGTATLIIDYNNPPELVDLGLCPEAGSFEFKVDVKDSVYEAGISPKNGSWQGLPGTSIPLSAWAEKAFKNDNNDEERTSEGLHFSWSIIEGEEYAELSDAGDKAEVTVKFKPISNAWDWLDEVVRVRLTIKDDAKPGEDSCVQQDIELRVKNNYYEVYPTMIDQPLHIGDTRKVTAKVIHYTHKDGKISQKVVDNVLFRWYYDDETIRIEDKNGKYVGSRVGDQHFDDASRGSEVPFTIKRLKSLANDIRLLASWTDENGQEINQEQDIFVEYADYDIHFDPDDTVVYDDYETTTTLDVTALEPIKGRYQLEFAVGYWDDPDQFNILDKNSGIYSIKDNQVTIYGNKVKEAGLGGVNIRAMAKNGDEELKETWCYVDLKEACKDGHDWAEKVISQPTCDSPGKKQEICSKCYEVRLLEIPATGHSMTKHDAKAATDIAEGNIEYYSCDKCKKLFSDPEGKKEITAKDILVPVSIPNAPVVSVSGNYASSLAAYDKEIALKKGASRKVSLFVTGMDAAKAITDIPAAVPVKAKIASVSGLAMAGGKVTFTVKGLKAGTTNINVKVGSKTAVVKVTVVKKANQAKTVAASKKKVSMKKGASKKLKVKITPKTKKYLCTDAITASSSKKASAGITAIAVKKGKAYVWVKGLKKGKSTITVKIGKKKAKIKLTVK